MRAFVFPGQGVQKKGMGRGLFERFPELCSRADAMLGYPVAELCLENPQRRLSRTEYAQPAIFVVNALQYLAATEELPPADFLAGHSLGEYSALFAAEAFDFETGLALVRRRAELMGQAEGGGMAAVVGASEAVVEEALRAFDADGVVIANYNTPEQFVLSGGKEELARLRPLFEALDGLRGFVPMRVSGAFHSPRMAPAAARFRDFLASVELGPPRVPVVSNVTARPFEASADAVRTLLAEQITQPVRWIECVRHLSDAGVSDFAELSETKVLTPFIATILASSDCAAPAELDEDIDPRREMIGRIKHELLQPEIGEAALGFDEDESFRQLGLNSVIYVRLARRVETVFGVRIKPDVIYQNRSCGALADFLLARDGVAAAAPVVPAVPAAASVAVSAASAAPAPAAPWHDHQDERVLALLRQCADGTIGIEQVIERIRAGGQVVQPIG